MDDLDVLTIIGLIGITLVITGGRIFDGLRKWLLGFAVWFNPLRILGEIVSCTMCAGWWVGASWSWIGGSSFGAGIVVGGLVSLLAFTADEALTILVASSARAARNLRPMPQQTAPPPPPPKPQRAPEDPPLTEEDAHRIVDEDENQ